MKAVSIIGAIKQVAPLRKWFNQTTSIWNLISLDNIKIFDSSNFFIQTNIYKSNHQSAEIYKKILNSNKPILVLENPLIRDVTINKHPKGEKWAYLGWNSYYQDIAVWPYDSSYDRWSELQQKFNISVKDWSRYGDNILFLLQKTGDSSLNRIYESGSDYITWVEHTIKEIRKVSKRKIIIRKHPLTTELFLPKLLPRIQNIDNIEISDEIDLKTDFNRSWCAVSYNSTATVSSVLYGLPSITFDPSAAAWPVTCHNLKNIENLIIKYDRLPWLQRLSFSQWQHKELNQYVLDLYLKCMPR